MAGTPFDQLSGDIWYDGEFVPWSDAKLHILSHGLHYGSSVFEGERAYGGRIFKSEEHTERLLESARTLGFEIPWTADQINAAKGRVFLRGGGRRDCRIAPEPAKALPGRAMPSLVCVHW